MEDARRGSLRFYLVALLLAMLAFVLGIWDAIVQRQGGSWLVQIILPALIIIVLAVLHSQARRTRLTRQRDEDAAPPVGSGPGS